jgi:hypothetical protein
MMSFCKEAHNEAIDSMDVSDNFGDDHGMEIMPDECFLDGVGSCG